MQEFIFTDVDSIQIEKSSKSICEHINELSSISNYFKCDVMTCLNPCWSGLAKRKFDQQFSLFAELFEDLVDSYKELNDRLNCAGVSYCTADNSVKSLIAKLPN